MSLLILGITLTIVLFIVKDLIKKINRQGFLAGTVCISAMLLFYFFVPFIYILFPTYRDYSTQYNILLGENDNIAIAINSLFGVFLIAIVYYVYQKTSLKNSISQIKWKVVNIRCSKRILFIANACLIIGIISIAVCILSVGGLFSYLALGATTRGIDKELSISSTLLPLITLSNIILVPPYLYKYLISFKKKSIKLKLCYYLSLLFAIIYLLYNQGRLPLVLFIIPFILDMNIMKEMSLGGLLIIAVVTIPLLTVMDSVFLYLTYGYWEYKNENSFFQILLHEFSYPFSNFINKTRLINVIGYRYGIDYIQWLFMIIPSSILSLFGYTKANLSTIGYENTEAYSRLLSFMPIEGGIPTDFMTFNYYQFGYFSLFLACLVAGIFLRNLDNKIQVIKENKSAHILILRICFLMISLLNNFDLSVIFRMRFDLIILLYIIYYMFSQAFKNKTVSFIK